MTSVQQFIDGLTPEYLVATTVEEAYAEYQTVPEKADSSIFFFKIKYNSRCRAEDITPLKEPLSNVDDIAVLATKHYTENPKHKLQSTPTETSPEDNGKPDLPKRVVVNYKDGTTKIQKPSLMPTGTLFDRLISKRVTSDEDKAAYKETYGLEMPADQIEIGGFTRQCVDITAGKAGSGKTYSRCILAAKAKIFAKREFDQDIRVGFISGEMRKSEWDGEVDECELFRELEVDYMLNYVGYPNYEEIFWEAVGDYDIVIVDSFPAIISHFRMMPGEKRTEKAITFDFIRTILQSVEDNDNNVQLINQAVKDGNYKGGTELPHMMSSMSFVHIDGQQRYMTFDKNRNNGTTCKRKLYFSKLPCGDIEFNEEVYLATYEQVQDKKASVEELINSLETSQQTLDGIGETNGDGTEMSAAEMEEKDQAIFEHQEANGQDGDVSTPVSNVLFAEDVEMSAEVMESNLADKDVEMEMEDPNAGINGIPQAVISAPFRSRQEMMRGAGPAPIETGLIEEEIVSTPRVEAEQQNAQ